MVIKSLNEVKGILEKFPEFSKAGYVVTPMILKLGMKLGLAGFEQAMIEWIKTGIFNEKVYDKDETPDTKIHNFFMNWEGIYIRKTTEGATIIGLKQCLELIDKAIVEMEQANAVHENSAEQISKPIGQDIQPEAS